MEKSIKTALACLLALALTACGRYTRPLPPEVLAPKAVSSLGVTAQQTGVLFEWQSPEVDRRGQELKTLDGYRLYRKEIKDKADVSDRSIPFDLLTTIEDKSVVERERLREEAKAQGKISRKVKADEALQKFSYIDSAVVPGSSYLYKLVPINQGGVEGEVHQLVKILFRGETSELIYLDDTKFETDITEDEA